MVARSLALLARTVVNKASTTATTAHALFLQLLSTGVAITVDGGRLFKPQTSDVIFTDARYAAFPTDDVWYVAAGEFPSNENKARRTVHHGTAALPSRVWASNLSPGVRCRRERSY